MISDFVFQEAYGRLSPSELKRVLRSLGLAVDRLLRAATAAYAEEADALGRSRDRDRVVLIERLLAGQLLEAEGLEYDLALSHLGVCAAGPGAADALRALARSADARLLAGSQVRV